jgi:riboflavin synthase
MFTGLIEDVGRVVKLKKSGSAARLDVATVFPLEEIKLGDSVAVNGVCLTVVEKGSAQLSFDISPETIDCTTFNRTRPGQPVNLERALRLGDRFGGHIVSGHVDCVATITECREVSSNHVFSFRLPGRFSRYVIEKGSITIEGISLTVNSIADDVFSVNIIPHTVEHTTLHYKKPGDEVNIETDIIGKYIERLMTGQKDVKDNGVTMELLAKSGFL